MIGKATSVDTYIDGLPLNRREAIKAVRETIRVNLPEGFEETMASGMIAYVVPLLRYPRGYLGKKDVPLPYISIASQKNHMAIYLMNLYGDEKNLRKFKEDYEASGKRLDMGKSCLRFKKLEDLPLNVIEGAATIMTPDEWIAVYEKARMKRGKKKR